MLNDRDRQVLDEMERHLTTTSPALVRRFERPQRWWVWGLPGAVLVAGLVVVLGLVLLGLPAHALVIAAVSAWPLARLLRRRRLASEPEHRPDGRGTADSSP